MRTNTKIVELILLSIGIVTACEKKTIVPAEHSSGAPTCIQTTITQIKSEPVRNPPASVWQYTYNGKIVYYIPPFCCDIYSQLLDENCNVICSPDGGIAGKGDCKCADFFDKRADEKLIWQDER